MDLAALRTPLRISIADHAKADGAGQTDAGPAGSAYYGTVLSLSGTADLAGYKQHRQQAGGVSGGSRLASTSSSLDLG